MDRYTRYYAIPFHPPRSVTSVTHRSASETPLYCVSQLLEPPPPLGHHAIFAEAAGAAGVDAKEFAELVHMWDVLKLDKVLGGKRTAGYMPAFTVALAKTRCSAVTAETLQARLDRIFVEGAPINGKALVGVPMLPNHLRGVLISQLHVLLRLRGETLPLEKPAELVAFLGERCGGVLDKLKSEWYVAGAEGGKPELRAEYAAPSNKAKKGNVAK